MPVPAKEMQVAVPEDMARKAADVVGFFEHGGGVPWQGVSGQEELSIGFMQWNWRTRTLTRVFMRKVPEHELLAAPEVIRDGLVVLKKYADHPTDRQLERGAADVIADWRTASKSDPVIHGGIRASVDAAWRQWLISPAVLNVQKQLIDSDMRKAYAYARQWTADSDTSGSPPDVDETLLAYFFDLVTFNGGPKGLWVPHARALRAQYVKPGDLVLAVSRWLQACVSFQSPRPVPNRKLYNRTDAQANARLWANAVRAEEGAFAERQLDLFAFAWLRAQRSTGDDPPRGFPGVYQADVMSRRGTIALGLGQTRGVRWPVKGK